MKIINKQRRCLKSCIKNQYTHRNAKYEKSGYPANTITALIVQNQIALMEISK